MTRYIFLIRGINVGGKNKVPMKELKEQFEAAGFSDVVTYINSGNVIASIKEKRLTRLVEVAEYILDHAFFVRPKVAVVSVDELQDAVKHAPDWWGDEPDCSHNALFVIAPALASEVMKEVGEARVEYEKVAKHGQVIFWSAPVKTFSRTRWSKIVGTPAYNSVTIRNANTVRKLAALTATE